MTASPRAIELAAAASNAAADKIATDIVAIDVSSQLAIADVFVVCTGNNDRQIHAIVDSVEDELRAIGEQPLRREGARDGEWVLLDYFDIVVHVMSTESRKYYGLERLWRDCPSIPMGSLLADSPLASSESVGGAF